MTEQQHTDECEFLRLSITTDAPEQSLCVGGQNEMTDTDWQDLKRRRGHVRLADEELLTFWRDFQTNLDWQIVIFSIEPDRRPGVNIISGYSRLFRPISAHESAPYYYLEMNDSDEGMYFTAEECPYNPDDRLGVKLDKLMASPAATHGTGGNIPTYPITGKMSAKEAADKLAEFDTKDATISRIYDLLKEAGHSSNPFSMDDMLMAYGYITTDIAGRTVATDDLTDAAYGVIGFLFAHYAHPPSTVKQWADKFDEAFPQCAVANKSLEFIEPDIQTKDLHDAMVTFGKACAESASLPDWMLGKRTATDHIDGLLEPIGNLDELAKAVESFSGRAAQAMPAPDPLAITRRLLR
jgi:hypothetical protein